MKSQSQGNPHKVRVFSGAPLQMDIASLGQPPDQFILTPLQKKPTITWAFFVVRLGTRQRINVPYNVQIWVGVCRAD